MSWIEIKKNIMRVIYKGQQQQEITTKKIFKVKA